MTAPGTPAIQARFALAFAGFALDVDLALPGRGVTALFGASGSGKTTLLRCIAGLERSPVGRLTVNGTVWQDQPIFVPTHRRAVGYVFQEASLFAHLSVRGNLDYGMKRVPPRIARQRSRGGDRLARHRRLCSNARRPTCRVANASAWRSPARWRSARSCC